MTTTAATTAPLTVCPWVTIWDRKTITASIAGGKVHRVTVETVSSNSVSGVADPDAKRNLSARTHCGTVRPGFRASSLRAAEDVTCSKCLKH